MKIADSSSSMTPDPGADGFYRSIVETLTELILRTTPEGIVLYANDAYCRYYAVDLASIIGTSSQTLIHPEDREIVRGRLASISPENPATLVENRTVLITGETRWHQWINSGIFNSDGVLEQIQSVGWDITGRKQVEMELRHSEEKFRMIYENAPIMIDSFDRDGNCILWNQSCERILGWTRDEVNAARDSFSLFYPQLEARRAVLENYGKADGQFREYRVWARDGSVHTQLWADFRLPDQSVISIGHDISERKHAEEELGRYRDHLEEMVNERTRQLLRVNEQLQREIAERKRAEKTASEQHALAESLRDSAAALSTTLDMEEVLDHLLGSVGRVVPHDAGFILLGENAGTQARVVRHYGFSARDHELIDDSRFTINDVEVLAGMAASHQPLCVAAVEDRNRCPLVNGLDWVRSYAGAPIAYGDEVMGFIILFSGTEGFFSQGQANLLLTFCNQVSIALRNARAYEQAGELAVLEERQRLAREMHDVVSQTLFSTTALAEALLQLMDDSVNARIKTGLEQMYELTRGSMAEMRTLLYELRPQSLEKADLGDLINQLLDGLAGRSRITIRRSISGKSLLPVDVKTAFFRIAQEGLNNLVKHARATELSVSLESSQDLVVLQIADNGLGFVGQQGQKPGLGLSIMRERAAGIGADLEIHSTPGTGTEVRLSWNMKP